MTESPTRWKSRPQYWIPEEIVLHLEVALGVAAAAQPLIAQLDEIGPDAGTRNDR